MKLISRILNLNLCYLSFFLQNFFFHHHQNPQKNLKEHGSKISDAEKKAIEDASSSLKEALKGTDNEDIKKKTETLVQASMKLGEAIYKSQDKKPESNKDDGKDEKGKKDDNVVDADFEEVKDDNKEKSA